MISKELLKKIDVASSKVPRLYARDEVNRDVLKFCTEILEKNIKGDFYEFGIYKGNITVLLGLIAKEYGRKVFAFDWFGGLKNFTVNDPDVKINPKVDLHGNGGDARNAITEYGLEDVVTLIEGDVVETIKKSDWDIASLVFMDVDLYEPTKAILDAIYENRLKINYGTIVATHDYKSGWDGVDIAFDEFVERNGLNITRFDSTTAYVRMGQDVLSEVKPQVKQIKKKNQKSKTKKI